MPRKPHATVHINLRLRESLRQKLARAADKHRVSLNSEIVLRLQDSFENKDAPRALHEITESMQLNWARLATHLAASQLEKEVTTALLQNKDPANIVKLLRDWLLHREVERRIVVPYEHRLFVGDAS